MNALTVRGGGRGRGQALKPIRTSGCGGGEAEAEAEPLSPGARVFHQPPMNCYIVAAIGTKTPISVEVIKEGLRETLIKHPRFSSKFMISSAAYSLILN